MRFLTRLKSLVDIGIKRKEGRWRTLVSYLYIGHKSSTPSFLALDPFGCWPFPCFSGQYCYAVQNNPDTLGYFHVNFIPSLIALLITQSAHREYSFVNDNNDIYSSITWYVVLLIWSTVLSQVGRMFYLRIVRKHWNQTIRITIQQVFFWLASILNA